MRLHFSSRVTTRVMAVRTALMCQLPVEDPARFLPGGHSALFVFDRWCIAMEWDYIVDKGLRQAMFVRSFGVLVSREHA